MSNGSQALGKTAKLGIGLTSLIGALGAVFRVRSPQRPHDTESSGPRGPSQYSLLKRMRKVPKFVVFLGLVLVVVLASAMVRAFALSGGCTTPTITWVGNGNTEPDSWHTASNWDANRVPGAGDHVCISSVANTDAIAFSTGTTSVASLESEEALTVTGGILELTSATEESKVNNLTLSGGTLRGAGNLMIPAGGNASWSGGEMRGSGKTLISAANGSENPARLTMTGTNTKGLHDNRVLENAGEVTMSGGSITSGTGALIKNTGIFDIKGDSDIHWNGFTPKSHFENTGTLKKSSGTDITDISTSLDNTRGTVDVTSGTLNLTDGLANFSSTGGVGRLAGGTYMIRSSSVLKFIGADIDVNAATIVLDGLGSAIVDQTNSDAIDNLSDNDGSFTIKSDRDLKTAGALRNDGSVTIGTGSVLTTTGEYVQAAGSTVLEDTTSKLAASGARVRVQDGLMKGLGTVEPALDATGGRVQPGLSSGILKVAGTYAQSSNGTLEVDIGGAAPGTGHDQLDVGTTASLGGTLDIVTPSSFTPTGGESFTILKCGAVACRSGQFDTVQGTNVGPGKEYHVRYNATDVTLELNNPPEANPDTAQTDEDTPLNDIDVLSNDEDLDGDSFSVSNVTQPSHGSAEVVDGKVNYTPNANYNGADSFSYTVSDGNGGTDTADVSITVNAVNDAPSFTKGDNQAVNEDAAAQTVDPWATEISGGPNEDNQTVDFIVTNDNNDLFSAQPQVAANGTLTYTPAADAFGSATLTVKAHDDGGTANGGQDESAEQTFQITVDSVNDEPLFNSQGNDQVNEDSGPRTASGWVTNFNPGPANESTQNVDDYIVTDANGDPVNSNLFSVQPDVSNDGTLSYTPAPDAYGSIALKVKVQDDGATANGGVDISDAQDLTITINSVNDAPSFTKGADETVNEDAGAQTVNGWATAISAGPNESGQTVEFIVTNDNNALFSAQPEVSSNGTLTYTPTADAFGNATVTIKAKDSGGTANGGQDESASQTFTITVNAVNDEPEATDDDAGTTPEDTPLTIQTADLLTNDSAGPPNESGQTLTVTAVSNGQNGQPVLNNDNTVTFTPAQDFNGDASFDYTVCDDGGTANGGQNCFQGTATVKVTLSQVNDAPSFTKGADQTVDAAAGAQTVNGWATAISAGPADENGQTVEFIVTNDNNALFSTQPSVAPDGTLSYTPAPDASGTATVSVKLKDSGGTANGGQDTSAEQTFTITTVSEDDNRVPVITSVTNNGPVNEGSPATTKITASDPDGDTLSYEFDCNNDNDFEVGPQSSDNAQCTFNDEGTYTVNARVDDGNGGTATGSTNVVVNNVNPTIGPLTVTGNSATACIGSTNVVKLSFSITDPGTADTHSGTISWGDGTTTPFTGSSVTDAQHSYSAGNYTITVNASDSDGGNAAPKSTTAGQVSLLYKVSELQDPVNMPSMTTPMSVFKYGSTIPLKVIITDCNNQPVSGLVPKINFTKVNAATPTIGLNEGLSTLPNDINFLMRDASNGQYIYNLHTKSLADGNATYNATITDSKATTTVPAAYGPKVSQNFGLRSK